MKIDIVPYDMDAWETIENGQNGLVWIKKIV